MSGQVASDEVTATPGRCRRCWLLLLLSRICVGARMRYRWWQCTKSSSRQRRSCRRPCGSCRWSMWRRRRQPNPRTCRVAANQRGRHSAVEPLTVGDREAFAKGVSVWAAAAAPDNRRAGLALAGHTDVRTRRLRLILCCHIDECPEMTGTQRWAKCSLPPRLKRRGAPCSRSALN